jgi:hypothetical protein
MDAESYLLIGLGLVLVLRIATVVRGGLAAPTPIQTAIGFVTVFFDTLGIGFVCHDHRRVREPPIRAVRWPVVVVVVYTSIDMVLTAREEGAELHA